MQIWAHRGASARQPENTIAAFTAAMAAGADGVEFDVQLSSDGVPVVIHDEKVDRTHAGTGWVASQTVAQLQALPSLLKKKPDPLTTRIPTLAEVLDLLAAGDQGVQDARVEGAGDGGRTEARRPGVAVVVQPLLTATAA
jgi:glycerophosphoryl diester phosphodiesterase